jgi:hypothetical protein
MHGKLAGRNQMGTLSPRPRSPKTWRWLPPDLQLPSLKQPLDRMPETPPRRPAEPPEPTKSPREHPPLEDEPLRSLRALPDDADPAARRGRLVVLTVGDVVLSGGLHLLNARLRGRANAICQQATLHRHPPQTLRPGALGTVMFLSMAFRPKAFISYTVLEVIVIAVTSTMALDVVTGVMFLLTLTGALAVATFYVVDMIAVNLFDSALWPWP